MTITTVCLCSPINANVNDNVGTVAMGTNNSASTTVAEFAAVRQAQLEYILIQAEPIIYILQSAIHQTLFGIQTEKLSDVNNGAYPVILLVPQFFSAKMFILCPITCTPL